MPKPPLIEPTVPEISGRVPIRSLRIDVLKGPDAGASLVTDTDVITLGTAASNSLQLSDRTVSRFHLEIRHMGDHLTIRDLGSTNGTHHGRVQLIHAMVPPDTTVSIGKTLIRLSDGQILEESIREEIELGELLGKSTIMRRLMARIERVAASQTSTLILGETGSGKELTARAIHEASPRAGAPFEVVDCGSLSPTLIASELFGHERGAFTGAERQHVGAFERANKGTLFLDEIGELPASLQAALLGALDRRSFRRVGGDRSIAVDVRIVAATNRDLRRDVNAGTFRADLYYRLGVVLLDIPPLRERVEDIPVLAEHFLREAGITDPLEMYFPPESMLSLQKHPWYGNVRELRNFVEATIAMGEKPALESEAEPSPSDSEGGIAPPPTPEGLFAIPLSELTRRPFKDARAQVIRDFERAYLSEQLKNANGNVSLAARTAKVSRTYVIKMLRRAHVDDEGLDENDPDDAMDGCT